MWGNQVFGSIKDTLYDECRAQEVEKGKDEVWAHHKREETLEPWHSQTNGITWLLREIRGEKLQTHEVKVQEDAQGLWQEGNHVSGYGQAAQEAQVPETLQVQMHLHTYKALTVKLHWSLLQFVLFGSKLERMKTEV